MNWKQALATTLLIVSPVLAAPTGKLLASKDFRKDLPDNLSKLPSQRKTASLSIKEKASFPVLVHYHQLKGHPDYFSKVEVELPKPAPNLKVTSEIGFPVNAGTTKKPRMTVPVRIQWASGRWSEARQWTLHPDGSLVLQP